MPTNQPDILTFYCMIILLAGWVIISSFSLQSKDWSSVRIHMKGKKKSF